MTIKENLNKILTEIPENVVVLAATKKQNAESIKQAVKAGIKVIGENRIQEAEQKFNEFDFKVEKHFIGFLQSNKAKKAVELFNCIQSVDSLKLIKKIDNACIEQEKTMPVFFELNLGEKQKSGITKKEIFGLAEEVSKMNLIKLNGLMFMAPFFDEPEKSIDFFIEAKQVFVELKKKHYLEFLSMGMSNDFVFAVKNGSNMIRIGRKLFE